MNVFATSGLFGGLALAGLVGATATFQTHTIQTNEVAAPSAAKATAPPEQSVALAACFAEDTPPEVVQAVGEAIYGLGQRFNTANRWPGSAFAGVELTYSFPPDGLFIPAQFAGDSSGDNEIHSRLNSLFGGNESLWKQKFRQAFDAWENVTGNTYTEVSDDGAPWPNSSGVETLRGDIRIVMRNIDGGSGVLAFNQFPSGGDMCLDRAENWGASGADFRFLRNVVTHEHGHGLGMLHVCPQNASKLMEPGLNTNFDGPQLDDFRGAQNLYGDRFEPNGSTGSGVDLAAEGILPNVPFTVSGVSLHRASDQDYYAIPSTASGATVSATLEPVGFTYLDGPQLSNGACSAGTPTEAADLQDLVLDVLSPAGSVLATSNVSGLGGSESLSDINLGSAEDHFIRVRSAGSGSVNSVQLYELVITVTDQGAVGDVNGDGCIDSTDLGILLGSWGPGPSDADLNGDGVVNSSDLSNLLGNWGNGCDD